MTTGIGPYETPEPDDKAASATVLETTITAALGTPLVGSVNIGAGFTSVNAETYNGAIPGPTLKLNVSDTVIVRLVNNLEHPTGIHWHGIELSNSADGTPLFEGICSKRCGASQCGK